LNAKSQLAVWHRYTTENLVLYIFFIFWVLIGIFAADWKVRAYIQTTHLIIFFSYLTVLSTFSTEKLIVFLRFLALWGLVYFILAFMSTSGLSFEFDNIKLAKWLSLKLIFFEGKKRASLLSPPAITAVFFGLCAWSAYLAGLLKQGRKYLYFVVAFFITLGIFYTRTRSEMVAFLFAGFAFVAILGWKRGYVVRGLTLCLIYVICVWIISSGLDLSRALLRIKASADVGETASLGIRLGLWKDGLLNLGQTYGIGEGTGGFFKYKAQWPHAHNVYFSVLFDLGLIGSLLWVIIYLNLWRYLIYGIRLVPEKSDEWLILVAFLAFFVEISLTSLLQHEYTHFIWWLFPGLLLAATNNAFKKHDLMRQHVQ
jgi:O-antigen ligase